MIDRRSFLRIAGAGGAVFASRLARGADPYATSQDEFFFVQLSDTHWGFQGAANPDALVTLPKAIAAVNALDPQPDFIVFTGDLTHTTDDPAERRRRLAGFKQNISRLKVREIRLMPGEHDASLDRGEAYKEFFGPTHYAFDHKGVHFIALDNVSDPAARIGEEQLAWLKADLEKQPREARIVVLTHRPLFPLYPQWDWATRRRQGDRAPHAAPQRHGVLRPHPPGASLQDRAHRAPLGEIAHLPAARAGLGAQARAARLGSGAALPRPGLA